MNKMIIRHTTKTLSLLALITLTTACSTQHLSSLPGSQLFGQQKDETKKAVEVASKTVKVPDVNTDTSAPMRKTILKAPVIVANDTTNKRTGTASTSAFGVVASEPKVNTVAPAAKPKAQPAPITAAKVTTIPKPPAAKVVTTSKPTPVSQNTTRRLTLNGSATFKTGSSRLSTDGKQKLAALARTLSAPNTKISRLLIEGHTDSAGSAAANQVLSLKRANAVADYLAQEGIMRASMETIGLGESTPIADNKTKSGRAQNRRVEITATGSRQTTR